MKRVWQRWVSLWDRTEPPVALAFVRMYVGVALLADLLRIAVIEMVGPMYSAAPDGFAMPATDLARALVERGLGPTVWAVAVIAGACVALGFATRVACIVLVFAMVQLAHIAPDSDRGIHVIFRVVLLILALSQSHARFSIDAWVWARLGRPFSAQVPAWPRYLLLLQLLWIYFSAGIQKAGAEWGPWGGFLAVANTATDPNYARFDPAWVETALPLTRLATAGTLLFEVTAPLYLVWLYCAATADRPGRARAWVNRLRLRWIWIALGVSFHLGLALTTTLGVFPWGMLALYPVLFRPSELSRGG